MDNYNEIKEYISKNILGIFTFIIGVLSIVSSIVYVKLNKCEVCEVEKPNESIAMLDENDKEEEVVTKPIIKVDVKGAVKKPGVYAFSEGSNVMDAILTSGGLTSNGVTSNINLSRKLKDEMVVYIFSKSELKQGKSSNSLVCEVPKCECESIKVDKDICANNAESNNSKEVSDEKISINSDDISELMKIDGIGESKAKAIIAYRNSHGDFKTIEEIKNVSGIGDKAYEKIKDKIRV